ncbi:MAG: CoA transferase [Desulfobacterales bacterium]
MAKLPLEGIRVIEITVVFAGPYAGQVLADLGAEVIRVESLQRYAPITRGFVPRPTREFVAAQGTIGGGYPNRDPGERPWNRFPVFNATARNKMSCTMDLSRSRGVEMFKRLIAVADVFVENNSAGVVNKLGIGYSELKKIKPDLIMLSAPGYGESGPYAHYLSYGSQIQAMSGFNWLRGYPDSDPTTTTSVVWMDPLSGMTMAFAVLMALHHRDKTGEGQFIEFAQIENMIHHTGDALMRFAMNKEVQKTIGNRHPSAAPHGVYRCKGENRWIAISVFNDDQWRGLCRVMGDPDWALSEKFSDDLSRLQHQDELDAHVASWTLGLDNYELMHRLQQEGVPAGPLMDERDVHQDPHVNDRKWFQEVTQEEVGTHSHPGEFCRMSKTPLSIRKPPCRLGEHNEYVYKDLIGVTDQEYAELQEEKHIGMDALW